MELTYKNIESWYSKKGYTFRKRPFEPNILGIRSSYKATNAWDDTLVIAYKTNDEEKVLVFKNFTTDPGYYFLKTKLLNPKGCAFVKEGNYPNLWNIGLHQGKYEALRQVRNIIVYRDANKDDNLDMKLEESGIFGINLHHGYNSKVIFNNSAGCQVVQSPTDLNTILNICKIKEHLYGKGIDYTLTNINELKL